MNGCVALDSLWGKSAAAVAAAAVVVVVAAVEAVSSSFEKTCWWVELELPFRKNWRSKLTESFQTQSVDRQ